MLALLAGLFAGTLHVVSGPDHLAAIAPLSARRGIDAARVGLRWGLGHSAGVILVGLLALLLRESLDLVALASAGERLVGLSLIGIGLWGLRRAGRDHIRHDEHEHGPLQHAHIHLSDGANSHRHDHAAFAVGTLHGLAGGSHLLGVVPAVALPTLTEAAVFFAAYAFGAIAVMTLFAAGVGRLSASRGDLEKPIFTACSAIAVAVGCHWLFL